MMLGELQLRQSTAFYSGEGDAWYDRNKDAVMNPIVIRELTSLKIAPKTIVEIGSSHGRYLNEMHKHYACRCVGFDPSSSAINVGKTLYPKLDLRVGTVRSFFGMTAELMVFGFCLYLVDREDIFSIVTGADYCIPAGGHIIIHDFDPETPQAVPYHHKDGLWSYKMDYAALWLANPAYRLISKTTTQDGEAISIIQKGEWVNGKLTFAKRK